MASNKTSILSRISVAASHTVGPRKKQDLKELVNAGPSMRARARIALAAAFLVATPALFVGVMRTEKVAEHASKLSRYEDYLKRLLEAKIAIKELDLTIWAYSTEREVEHAHAVLEASEHLRLTVEHLVNTRPSDLNLGPKGFIIGLVTRLDGVVKRSIESEGSMAQARLSIMSLAKELQIIEMRVVEIAHKERKYALGSLSMVGRDQLVLFLILMFAIPVFVGFVPGWLVAPLSRLRQLASKIELGQLKDIPVSGNDEVASLARNLRSYFLKKEDLDQKKSSKIFEMRNVLRSVINRVDEPVIIVDGGTKINYTNDAAASIFGIPSHQMEGRILSDCFQSPLLKKLVDKAFLGDAPDETVQVSIEVIDGRSLSLDVKLGVVRNRNGDLSRVVMVFVAQEEEKMANAAT